MKSASIWSRLAGLATTPVAPGHYLSLVSPHRDQARVEAVHDETHDVRTLTLRTGVPHRAGQHVRVQLAVDGRLTTRMYSVSSAERRDGRIAITVKAQGRVSRALRDVKPGDYLTIGPPEGDFVLPADPAHLLFVTGTAANLHHDTVVTAVTGYNPMTISVSPALPATPAKGDVFAAQPNGLSGGYGLMSEANPNGAFIDNVTYNNTGAGFFDAVNGHLSLEPLSQFFESFLECDNRLVA